MIPTLDDVIVSSDEAGAARPIWLVGEEQDLGTLGLTPAQVAWAAANRFSGRAKSMLVLPDAAGGIGGVLFGLGAGATGEPCGAGELHLGHAAGQLPGGLYRLAPGGAAADPTLAAIAWALGSYAFQRYVRGGGERQRLVLPEGADAARVRAIAGGVWLGRDLINTPANDLGPAELAAAAGDLAALHGAECVVARGEDPTFAREFPLIDAVGRASDRKPRLVDIRWQGSARGDAPKVTLVGKGICFDTGGLDIKPASGMLLMKKDMGGAAAVLALAHMVMSARLPVRLRVLIAAAENAISGNAFRPGDVIRSRGGLTVEIGNTDAEGRLVLADALAVADQDAPDLVMTFATLTGAARVALGPDLPPLYSTDDAFAAEVGAAGLRIGDPIWRMPLWPGYDRDLDSPVADLSNVSDGPFAGSVTAALFLQRFVRQARAFAHFDIYGWRPRARPLGPKGGEPNAARAVFEVLCSRYGTAAGA